VPAAAGGPATGAVVAPTGNIAWSPTGTIRVDEPTRWSIVWETWFVMVAFLILVVSTAVVELA